MKLFKSKAFAILVMIVVILVASFYGIKSKPAVDASEDGIVLDSSLSTAEYEQYIVDEAGVLSAQTEKQLSVFNANWVKTAKRVLAVVTVEGTEDLEGDAWAWAEYLELYDDDAILVIDAESEDYTVVAAGTFYDDLSALSDSFVDDAMFEHVKKGDYDAAVLSLFEQMHSINKGGKTISFVGSSVSSVRVSVIVMLVIFVIFLIMIFSLIDSMRYSRWNARYGSMATPPVVYRPILWWHRPGGRWYRRHRMAPPPPPRRHAPPPPRPSMGGGHRPPMGGGRPPMSGGHRPPSRPSAPSRPSSGSFGGGRSGSFGSSGRSGSFGGGRSGSFGSSGRSGSFGGGSRGGSMGGGSRGGSFGGGRGRR